MSTTIKLRRGLKADLPTLDIGEQGYVIDEDEIYIGDEGGNKKVTHKAEIENLTSQLAYIPTQTYITDKAKTVDVNNALTLKANKVDLDETNSRVTVQENKKISQTDCTPELIAQIVGTTAINATPADYSIVNRQFKNPMVVGVKSKNLFDLTDITAGYFVNYSTGNLNANASYSASNYIPIKASTYYAVSGTSQQCAFYDSNKAYISGVTSTNTPFQSPANAAYIKLSMYSTEATSVQLEEGNAKTSYESFNPRVDLSTIRDVIPESKLDLLLIRGTIKNLFNKATVTVGKLVYYVSGNLVTQSGCNASDYIPVSANTNYKVSGTKQQGAFYDSNKVFISGLTDMSTMTTTPANCAYIRLTVLDAELNSAQIEKGSVVTPYESYANKIETNQVRNYPTVNSITVDINGTGDFTNLSSAVASIKNSCIYNTYDIYVKPGVYDVFSTLTAAELAANGILLPDYVNVIGIGDVELKGEIPSVAATLDNTTRIATINLKYNNNLKNLKITAKNMRYAVHDESSNAIKDWTRNVDDCTFIHYGNDAGMWEWTSAYGEGCSSGSDSNFKNCEFIDYTINPSYGMHNNTGFTNPSYHQFDNCNFVNLLNGSAVRVGSMGSSMADKVVFNGCNFVGKIHSKEELADGCGIDFVVSGHSNQQTIYDLTYSNSGSFIKNLQFTDEVYSVVNTSGVDIPIKSLVKLNGSGTSKVSTIISNDTALQFYGIALETISNGSFGKVRVKGYIRLTDTNLSSANVGDKIGIVNGVLAVVTSGDYIGVCDISGYIRLK